MNAFVVIALLLHATMAYQDKTVARWLTDQGNYTQMISMLKSANVYATLETAGPFTVFAVPDKAFGAVPAATMAHIATNPAVLESFVKYHVINAFILEPQMNDGETRDSLNGKPLLFSRFANHSAAVDNVMITQGDFILNNGLVHVLARPLLSVTETIAQQLIKDEHELQDFLMVLMVTHQATRLTIGNWTLFAPSNAAIAAVSSQIPDFVDHDNAIAYYIQFVNRHLVHGTLYISDLHDGDTITTVAGTTLTVGVSGKNVTVSGAHVTKPNLVATNGVTHVVDDAFFN